jgi:hypothetical protein
MLWDSMKKQDFTLKQLRKLAKKDNPTKYNKLKYQSKRPFIDYVNNQEFVKFLNYVITTILDSDVNILSFGFNNYVEQLHFNRILKHFAGDLFTPKNYYYENNTFESTLNINIDISNRYLLKNVRKKFKTDYLSKFKLPTDYKIQVFLENLNYDKSIDDKLIDVPDYTLYLLHHIHSKQNDYVLYIIAKILYNLDYTINDFIKWNKEPDKSANIWTSLKSINPKYNLDLLLYISSLYANISLKKKSGCIYIVIPVGFNRVKVGFSTGTIESIRMRYVTAYGNDMKIFTYNTLYPEVLEKAFQKHFKNKNVCGELFDHKFIEDYKAFLTENHKKNVIELKNLFKNVKLIKPKEELNLDYDSACEFIKNNIDDIPNLNILVDKYKASNNQKFIIKVYDFNTLFQDKFKNLKNIFDIYNSKKKQYLMKFYDELYNKNKNDIKLQFILSFNEELSMKHSMDINKTYEEKDLIKFYEKFKDKLEVIKKEFSFRSKMEPDHPNKSKLIANYLSPIYKNWNSLLFRSIELKRVMKNYVTNGYYTYSFIKPDNFVNFSDYIL